MCIIKDVTDKYIKHQLLSECTSDVQYLHSNRGNCKGVMSESIIDPEATSTPCSHLVRTFYFSNSPGF